MKKLLLFFSLLFSTTTVFTMKRNAEQPLKGNAPKRPRSVIFVGCSFEDDLRLTDEEQREFEKAIASGEFTATMLHSPYYGDNLEHVNADVELWKKEIPKRSSSSSSTD